MKIGAEEGFSLTELLVVIVIIGILVLLAMPRFNAVITRAKTTEAKTMLKHLHVLQCAYFYENDKYAETLSEVGFEQAVLVTEGGDARYQIVMVRADASTYLAEARAVIDFDRDGELNVWQIDQTGQIKQLIPD